MSVNTYDFSGNHIVLCISGLGAALFQFHGLRLLFIKEVFNAFTHQFKGIQASV